jgi:hypothetical protein
MNNAEVGEGLGDQILPPGNLYPNHLLAGIQLAAALVANAEGCVYTDADCDRVLPTPQDVHRLVGELVGLQRDLARLCITLPGRLGRFRDVGGEVPAATTALAQAANLGDQAGVVLRVVHAATGTIKTEEA